MQNTMIETVHTYLTGLQDQICLALEDVETTARFGRDEWVRPEGGGGCSCVLEEGGVVNRENWCGVFGERAAGSPL